MYEITFEDCFIEKVEEYYMQHVIDFAGAILSMLYFVSTFRRRCNLLL